MINFKIKRQEIHINEKIIKFDFPILETVFFNNCFYVLFEPMSVNEIYGQRFNLYAVDLEGKRVWTAELPEAPDYFLIIYVKNNQFYAYSYSDYRCSIDIETGKIKEKIFTK